MPIRGSLETFSLPELFQIIESGCKSGRLILKPTKSRIDIVGIYKLWFDQGQFITITNSMVYQALIAEIQDNAWIDSKLLVQNKYFCPANMAFGDYLMEKKFLTPAQIDLLFKTQLNTIYKLFTLDSAKFKFEELDHRNKIASDEEQFPYTEMTGKQKKATQLSLEAMRNLSDWSLFREDLPSGDLGLQQLVSIHDLELSSLENNLWSFADSSISLAKIAQRIGYSLEEVRQTSLSMILAGLIEEVPVSSSVIKVPNASKIAEKTTFIEQSNVSNAVVKKSTVTK